MRNVTVGSRICVGAMLALAVVTATACSNSVSGTAIGTGSTQTAGASGPTAGASGPAAGARSGAASPKAAVQALLDGVKANDSAKIKAVTCQNWPGLAGTGTFDLNAEMDPPAQSAFPNGVVGEPRRVGDTWQVPVTMKDEMGTDTATIKVVQAGSGYIACGMDLKIGG
jgi:hypothetical protein